MRILDKYMDFEGKTDLRNLATERQGPCVSIFMPTREFGANLQAELLRLQQLLDQAVVELVAQGLSLAKAQEMLAPTRSHMENSQHFLQKRSAGLAIFLAPGTSLVYHLPLVVKEIVKVGEHFYLEPLFSWLSGDGKFYLLALSQNQVKFFRGTRSTLEPVALPDVPHSWAEVQPYSEAESMRQVHSGGSSGLGSRHPAPVYTGQGSTGDEKLIKQEIAQFLQQVDRAVNQVLAGQTAPLLVAGVDMLRGLYKEITHYHYLLPDPISGNPDHVSVEALQARAWNIVAPLFQQSRQQAILLYRQLAGTQVGRTTRTLRLALLSAYEQRIDTLFVAADAQQSGTFDPATRVIEIDEQPQVGDEDLINLAAIYTLRNHGIVYVVEPGELPDAAPMAAILRY